MRKWITIIEGTADSLLCKKQVQAKQSSFFHGCKRTAVKDGYCLQHHPDSEQARRDHAQDLFDRAKKLRLAMDRLKADRAKNK